MVKSLLIAFTFLLFGFSGRAQTSDDYENGELKLAVGGAFLVTGAIFQGWNQHIKKGNETGPPKFEPYLNYTTGVMAVLGGACVIWGISDMQNEKRLRIKTTQDGLALVLKF